MLDSKLTRWNVFSLISVCLAFLWRPLNVWYFELDGAARVPFVILFLAFIANWAEIKRTSLVASTKLYSFIALYMMGNAYVMGSAELYPKGGNWIIFVNIMEPVAVMLMVLNCAQKDFTKTMKILLFGMLIYCLMTVGNSTISERGRLDAEINANEMALYGAITIGITLLLRIRGSLKNIYLFVLALPAYMIVRTGSRMGFAMITLMVFMYVNLNNDFKNPSTVLRTLILFFLAIFAVHYVVNNTLLGDRLLGTASQVEDKSALQTGTILDYYGDRGFQYYVSWPVFLENPIFGIGFHRWVLFSPTGHACHSELMVQYVECGLVSFIPWCIFWYLIVKPLNIARKYCAGIDQKTIILMMTILGTMFYADTVLWSYNQFCIFIMYALVIAYPKMIKS